MRLAGYIGNSIVVCQRANATRLANPSRLRSKETRRESRRDMEARGEGRRVVAKKKVRKNKRTSGTSHRRRRRRRRRCRRRHRRRSCCRCRCSPSRRRRPCRVRVARRFFSLINFEIYIVLHFVPEIYVTQKKQKVIPERCLTGRCVFLFHYALNCHLLFLAIIGLFITLVRAACYLDAQQNSA